MKTLKLFLVSVLTLMASTVMAATAHYNNGKLTLNFIGDFATVENGTGEITIVDAEGIQIAAAIGDPDYDYAHTNDWQVLIYTMAGKVDAGSYTVKVADGAIRGDKTDAWGGNCQDIPAFSLPLEVSENNAGGGDTPQTLALYAPDMQLLAGPGVNIKYAYPHSNEGDGYEKVARAGSRTAYLFEDGSQVATSTFDFLMEPDFFYGAHFDYTIQQGKEYKVTFEAGCWYIAALEGAGFPEVESPSESFSWIGGETTGTIENQDENPGNDNPGNLVNDKVSVNFFVGSSLAAIKNNMKIADVTVDKAYYGILWHVRCATDPEFYYGGMLSGTNSKGTYTIIAATPGSEPVELNAGRTYTFSFESCEFGWDAPKFIASFDVTGTGAAPEEFSDIQLVDIGCTPTATGYPYKKTYTATFSAPVNSVRAFAAMGMLGTQDFPVTAADTQGLKWKIDCSSVADTEGGFELHIQARDAATGLRLKGNFNVDHSFIYTIFVSESIPSDDPELPGTDPEVPGTDPDQPQLPDEPVIEPNKTEININGTIYTLSETEAIELETYPEGAVITATLHDEAIKKVSYEIIDHTTGEILKSISDLTQGSNDEWTATMPKNYDLAQGHVFYVHVIARDGMSSFTSKVLYEFNYLINGTANVPTYSEVKVVSVTPSTAEILTDATPVVTLTFSEAIATVSAKAITGQLSSLDIPAANITTADHVTWQILCPAQATVKGSLSLNVVAIDNEGHRVNDETNGVGLPENCYLSYGWASIIGLPTPQLAEDGQTLETLETLTFTYEGIGLNEDNATATWNKITITYDGAELDMELTEDLFTVSGNASVGGDKLTLALPYALTDVGTYTITVPAYAFMLGHDQSNFYSGACTFTVIVYNTPTGIHAVGDAQQTSLYQLNGQKSSSMTSGNLYIRNGQKVIVK